MTTARRLLPLLVLIVVPPALAADPTPLAARLTELDRQHAGKVAIAVKHLGTGESFVLNADEPLPTASLIKFPIMVEAYHQFQEGKVRPGDLVQLAQADMVQGSGVLSYHFSPGASFTLRDAVRLMIVYSDNTATNLVLDHLGIPATNTRMEGLGLPHTKINAKVFRGSTTSVAPDRTRKFGLGSTTANEMIKLLTLLHEGKLVDSSACREMLGHLEKCEDPGKFPRFLPPGTKVAMKTGSVSNVRTCAGIIQVPTRGDPKKLQPVAVCVMTNENKDTRYGPDSAGDLMCARVAKEVYDYFATK